jgi:hypothetical protein
MFHGQPYCERCGYEGPNFMWMWHHMWGFRALVQDQASLELRTVEVPDDEVFYRREGLPKEERERERDAYVAAVIAGQLRPGERHVPSAEFARFAAEGEERPATDLPCPRCRSLLLWRHTGIS